MEKLSRDAALAYVAKFGWPVFPCKWRPGPDRKKPLTEHGFKNAGRDPEQITAWWTRWPQALIGVPTGKISGVCILDIDVKNPKKYGLDSLEILGRSILDDTWIAHTASGGWHVYYDPGAIDIPSTSHTIGLGLDVRGEGGDRCITGLGLQLGPDLQPQHTAAGAGPGLADPAASDTRKDPH